MRKKESEIIREETGRNRKKPEICAVHELNCAYFFGETPTAFVNAFR